MNDPVRRSIKRAFDLLLAVSLIILSLPIMALVALAVSLESPGGFLYSQERAGAGGRPFRLYKFRSMVKDAEKNGARWAQKNDSRVTRVGKFIRRTRLDELPQLYNVIRGEMSFIGPRPERDEFNRVLEREIPFYHLRTLVQPGLTGWAQVRFPYGASVEDSRIKLQFELYYIKNHSIFLDLAILLRTVSVVLLGAGR